MNAGMSGSRKTQRSMATRNNARSARTGDGIVAVQYDQEMAHQEMMSPTTKALLAALVLEQQADINARRTEIHKYQKFREFWPLKWKTPWWKKSIHFARRMATRWFGTGN